MRRRSRHPIRLPTVLLMVASILIFWKELKFLQNKTENAGIALAPNNDFSYTRALATLRCLVTPGCFPSKKCTHGRPQRIPRRKDWEEQAFCTDDLKKSQNCLVYSFGVHESPDWEVKIHKYFGCEVHAFDPTMDYSKNQFEGVTFHKLGLQGAGTDMSDTHAFEYDAIDPKLLLPLDKIMTSLGHTSLDVLMLDCEGCEWGVLKQLACSGSSQNVKQIVVELHFQKVLGLKEEQDVLTAADAVTCLWQNRWGIVAIEQSGCAPENAEYAQGVSQVIHDDLFLLHVAFQRTPDNEPLFSDLVDKSVQAMNVFHNNRSKLEAKYGENGPFPEKAQAALQALNETMTRSYHTEMDASARTIQFDEFERVEGIPV